MIFHKDTPNTLTKYSVIGLQVPHSCLVLFAWRHKSREKVIKKKKKLLTKTEHYVLLFKYEALTQFSIVFSLTTQKKKQFWFCLQKTHLGWSLFFVFCLRINHLCGLWAIWKCLTVLGLNNCCLVFCLEARTCWHTNIIHTNRCTQRMHPLDSRFCFCHSNVGFYWPVT